MVQVQGRLGQGRGHSARGGVTAVQTTVFLGAGGAPPRGESSRVGTGVGRAGALFATACFILPERCLASTDTTWFHAAPAVSSDDPDSTLLLSSCTPTISFSLPLSSK
ncbi:uncharacterized protein F5147DRAFT_767432 [Suillus discolor]|uniref:Uncharacterized protein n=1 Tax=Suillus discolor TaxID=1912936 RepID=A0A9P7FJM6_9AGAM|nr:uncharacterized protein F5147DRAFT_767432 [Suillus discolor]KAG2118668.1 hypothetical protein F5147DRAFT_767432 [Suillus discolor]